MSLSPQEKELLRRIDEILFYVWDPIGVARVPQARDEYENYVPQIFRRLKATTGGQDIAEYLHWLSTEHMGLEANQVHDAEVVKLLLRWRNHLVP
ncbi:hypothetical protein [Dyella sp. 2HG41-7]|uniref:hypothetical protein n=1 Tax=Dyella sp. 2HG41-7 TaxID=2883239 RepID=UPI001F2F6851|nr:hypothetical protein [Dyella sp. 2HG41-7]